MEELVRTLERVHFEAIHGYLAEDIWRDCPLVTALASRGGSLVAVARSALESLHPSAEDSTWVLVWLVCRLNVLPHLIEVLVQIGRHCLCRVFAPGVGPHGVAHGPRQHRLLLTHQIRRDRGVP